MESDLELLERWRAGDKGAGERLFRAHFAEILRFFEGKAGVRAEDLAQQTFLECVKARNQFRGDSSFRTYLFAIARHELFRYIRREAGKEAIDFDVSSMSELSAGLPSPSSNLHRARQRHQLHQALATLPVELQLLLEYHYWHDLDAAALGEIFGASPGAIRVRLTRARVALRRQVDRMAAGGLDEDVQDRLAASLIDLAVTDQQASND